MDYKELAKSLLCNGSGVGVELDELDELENDIEKWSKEHPAPEK